MPKHATSTSFKEGNQASKGHGRKGYDYEKTQLEKMRKILNRALLLTEKVMSGKANYKEGMAYEGSIRMVLKIMDKLHANREHVTVENPEQAEALKKIADSIEKIAEEK
jgi:hypothetical protein